MSHPLDCDLESLLVRGLCSCRYDPKAWELQLLYRRVWRYFIGPDRQLWQISWFLSARAVRTRFQRSQIGCCGGALCFSPFRQTWCRPKFWCRFFCLICQTWWNSSIWSFDTPCQFLVRIRHYWSKFYYKSYFRQSWKCNLCQAFSGYLTVPITIAKAHGPLPWWSWWSSDLES